MNSNELKSFLMVYEYRSFSLAAKRLFVTQSAVSKRINNLENEFKVKLFETRGGMIFPTMEGQLLIPYARLLLHTLYNAADNLKNPELEEIPVFLGISTFPLLQFLPQFLEHNVSNNINLPNIHIKQMMKRELLPALQNGLIDLVITTEEPCDNAVIKKMIYEEEVHIVVSPKNKLASEKHVNLEMLSQHPSILIERGYSIRDNLERIFSKHGLHLLVSHELFSLNAIQRIVKTGLGWSALPKQFCDNELVCLKVDHYNEKIRLCWYCHENRADSKIIRYLGELLDQSIQYIRFPFP